MSTLLKGSPWNSKEELAAELEKAWEDMKEIGLRKGILTKRSDGAIVGKGHPDKWFDAVEEEQNVYRKNF